MSKTNYAGLDYSGPGATCNRDTETGIRYGVIQQNDVMSEAMEDVFQGDDIGFERFKQEIKQRLDSALTDYLSATACCEAFDAIEDYIGDAYSANGESGPYRYEKDGYALQTDDSGDLWVFKSEFFTFAQFCSPCAPGACYLSNPLESPVDGNACYCLGHDWFEGGKAPYPVYSVETGTELLPV